MPDSLNKLQQKQPGEIRIAHLSDLHISWTRSNIKKQVKKIAKSTHMDSARNFQAVMDDLARREIDHIIITGDITGGGKLHEFDIARQILNDHIEPKKMTIIPGNHDISYKKGLALSNGQSPAKFHHFLACFKDTFPKEYPEELNMEKRKLFPFIKYIENGDICIIGVDTTIRFSPKVLGINAFGSVGEYQINELSVLLSKPALKNKYKIVVMHHHPIFLPFYDWGDHFKFLVKGKRLLDMLYAHDVDMILHGHKHHPFCWQSHNYIHRHDIAIVCAGPPNAYGGHKLVYNIYSIQDNDVNFYYQECKHNLKTKKKYSYK